MLHGLSVVLVLIQVGVWGNGLIGFGVLYALILIVGVVSPDMFGLMDMAPMNAADHVLHLVLAGGALAVGFASRSTNGVRRTA